MGDGGQGWAFYFSSKSFKLCLLEGRWASLGMVILLEFYRISEHLTGCSRSSSQIEKGSDIWQTDRQRQRGIENIRQHVTLAEFVNLWSCVFPLWLGILWEHSLYNCLLKLRSMTEAGPQRTFLRGQSLLGATLRWSVLFASLSWGLVFFFPMLCYFCPKTKTTTAEKMVAKSALIHF